MVTFRLQQPVEEPVFFMSIFIGVTRCVYWVLYVYMSALNGNDNILNMKIVRLLTTSFTI